MWIMRMVPKKNSLSPIERICPSQNESPADAALARARTLVSRFEEEPHLNPSTQTMEFSLRDPDGYYVTISAL